MEPGEPVRDVVRRLDPLVVPIDDADAFFNVNAPEDVLRASAGLLTTDQRTTPCLSMMKVPRTATPIASSKTP